eukprot:69474-Rhodomonas_salina.3
MWRRECTNPLPPCSLLPAPSALLSPLFAPPSRLCLPPQYKNPGKTVDQLKRDHPHLFQDNAATSFPGPPPRSAPLRPVLHLSVPFCTARDLAQ